MTYRTAEQTADWITSRLEALGMNQEELAAAAGIAPANLSRYKRHIQRPGIDQVQRLALALGVDVVTMLVELGAIDPDAESTPQIHLSGGGGGTVTWTAKQRSEQ